MTLPQQPTFIRSGISASFTPRRNHLRPFRRFHPDQLPGRGPHQEPRALHLAADRFLPAHLPGLHPATGIIRGHPADPGLCRRHHDAVHLRHHDDQPVPQGGRVAHQPFGRRVRRPAGRRDRPAGHGRCRCPADSHGLPRRVPGIRGAGQQSRDSASSPPSPPCCSRILPTIP